jgi:NitT/TauT family transport system substrate-binding protein
LRRSGSFARTLWILAALSAQLVTGPASAEALRIGYFPNLTHAQALCAQAEQAFEQAAGMPIEWVSFNAGPSAVEALFSRQIDLSFIGPNPAINGFLKSEGKSFAVVAGAASGGAALVVRNGVEIQKPADFAGKTIATPQLGNTQDVAARTWLRAHGLAPADRGGKVSLLPIPNADMFTLMARKQIDAAWTVEPWVSRLQTEAGARLYLDESELWQGRRYPTTVLVASRSFMTGHGDKLRALLAAHAAITSRIQQDKGYARACVSSAMRGLSGSSLPDGVASAALARIEFTTDPMEDALQQSANNAAEAGFLPVGADLHGLVQRQYLPRSEGAR